MHFDNFGINLLTFALGVSSSSSSEERWEQTNTMEEWEQQMLTVDVNGTDRVWRTSALPSPSYPPFCHLIKEWTKVFTHLFAPHPPSRGLSLSQSDPMNVVFNFYHLHDDDDHESMILQSGTINRCALLASEQPP